MRPVPSLMFALAAALAGAPAHAQSWETYSYPEAQFAVHFPAKPAVTKGAYATTTGVSVPATIYSVRHENVVYRMTIADFSKTTIDAPAGISDAVKAWGRRGEVKLDVEARINRQWGRELSVVGKDGSRSMAAIFFFGGKLYELDGMALPPNADRSGGRLIRFQQSLAFMAE